jgi:ankyrin repeat protein
MKIKKRLGRDLLNAVAMRDTSLVRELLGRGADVNARDEEHGDTPLMFAVKFADASMLRLLLDAGARVDARDDAGRTALFFAPVSSEMFRVLLSAGADVHARDDEGNTLLMRKVSESASLADVEELLRLGVDPGLRNNDGETALDLAEILGLLRIVEILESRQSLS